MEEKGDCVGQIEELDQNSDGSSRNPRTVRTKVPEVEIQLYRQGRGPIDVFKSCLGGWDQDQLEVRNILEKYGLKSIFAFNTQTGRGVPIRFNPRNGRSMLHYRDGSVVYIDGEPKDSLIKPVTRILFGVAAITL
ncbi:WD repeat protein [Quillaja saponaria]|uniref:WD repeat protein n=1 Tax=Quillaja saponaria TaxID=32244 RepID=A0AAD7VFJ8_QUISA|nr:WD repeat protein [Quillaja saponaria]